MKHLKLAMICLGLALTVMVVTEAEAGRTKKPKKDSRTEKTEEMKKPRRFDNQPTMDFLGGTLSQDAHTGWKIGGTSLYLRKDCVIIMDGTEGGWLEEGRQAVVMGSRVGNAISAWSIHIAQPEYKTMGLGQSKELKEAGPNPNVGKILKPVE
jgi:hypothetical protein